MCGAAVGIEHAEFVGGVARHPIATEGIAHDGPGILTDGVLGEFGARRGIEDGDRVRVGVDHPEPPSIGIVADHEGGTVHRRGTHGRRDHENTQRLGNDGAVGISDLHEDAWAAGRRVGVGGGRCVGPLGPRAVEAEAVGKRPVAGRRRGDRDGLTGRGLVGGGGEAGKGGRRGGVDGTAGGEAEAVRLDEVARGVLETDVVVGVRGRAVVVGEEIHLVGRVGGERGLWGEGEHAGEVVYQVTGDRRAEGVGRAADAGGDGADGEVDAVARAAAAAVFVDKERKRGVARVAGAIALGDVVGDAGARRVGGLLVHPYAEALRLVVGGAVVVRVAAGKPEVAEHERHLRRVDSGRGNGGGTGRAGWVAFVECEDDGIGVARDEAGHVDFAIVDERVVVLKNRIRRVGEAGHDQVGGQADRRGGRMGGRAGGIGGVGDIGRQKDVGEGADDVETVTVGKENGPVALEAAFE